MPAQVQTQPYPPPTAGWIAAGNLMNPPQDGAAVLDNIFPTAQGGRLRYGSALHGTADAPVVQLRAFRNADTRRLLACTASDIYDLYAPADPEVTPAAIHTGLTSGDWSTAQISTAGGVYLSACNGADTPFYYDGTTVVAYNGAGLTLTGSGLTPSDLEHVNQFGERLFFVERDSLNVWYLAVDNVGGALTKFPMGSVFSKGAKLLMTATWSVDAGDGLDDLFCAFSTEGEVAIYQGVDPASWSKVGLYQIGKPIDKHSAHKVGGELMVVTDAGVVPVSAAVNAAEAQQSETALTVKIEDAWQKTITTRTTSHPIPSTYWARAGMMLIGTEDVTDDGYVCFVSNTRTGAWCRYTGWDVHALAELGSQLFWADDTGKVFQGEVGGSDNGTSYRGIYVPVFTTMGSTQWKIAHEVNAVFRATVDVTWKAGAYADWTFSGIGTPAPLGADTSAVVWGSGTWGSDVWGGTGEPRVTNTWHTAVAQGLALAPGVCINSNTLARPEVEILATQITYERGNVMV